MICLLSFNQAVQCTPHTVQPHRTCYLSHAYLSALQMGQYKFVTSKITKTIIAFKEMDPKLLKLLEGNLFYWNRQIFGNLYQLVDVDEFFWGTYGKFGIIKFWIIFLPSAETNTNEYFSALPFISGSAASSFAFLIGPSLTRTVYLNFISLLFLAKLAVCYFSAFKIFPGPHSRDLFL